MTVRSFDWRDLPALHKYRDRGLFLDTTRLLTQGPRLVPVWALFSQFASATGIFTYQTHTNGSEKMLGQVIHTSGAAVARISFIAPAAAIGSPALPELLEGLTKEIGGRGAMHLIAEVDELDDAYEALRKAGFAIYTRQRIWRVPQAVTPPNHNGHDGASESAVWSPSQSIHYFGIRSLYCNLVPGLVQQVEPQPGRQKRGFVLKQEGEVLGYCEIKSGPAGIWLQPFIHPDLESVSERLDALIQNIPYRRNRPVYICVRSYQGWIEPALDRLGAEAGPRQAVMVKHLAIAKKVARSYVLPAIERGHAEVTAPIARRTFRKL